MLLGSKVIGGNCNKSPTTRTDKWLTFWGAKYFTYVINEYLKPFSSISTTNNSEYKLQSLVLF